MFVAEYYNVCVDGEKNNKIVRLKMQSVFVSPEIISKLMKYNLKTPLQWYLLKSQKNHKTIKAPTPNKLFGLSCFEVNKGS